MDIKKYRQLRAGVILFLTAIIIFSITSNFYLLSAACIFTGMLFLILVRFKVKIRVDERELTIREKAAQMAYAIFAPTLGIGAFLLLIPYQKLSPVFAKGEFTYLESLGMVLAYLTLFLITIYAISYYFLNRKYGGGGSEE